MKARLWVCNLGQSSKTQVTGKKVEILVAFILCVDLALVTTIYRDESEYVLTGSTTDSDNLVTTSDDGP